MQPAINEEARRRAMFALLGPPREQVTHLEGVLRILLAELGPRWSAGSAEVECDGRKAVATISRKQVMDTINRVHQWVEFLHP